jgi:cell wall-associated NlpC family hydrolase
MKCIKLFAALLITFSVFVGGYAFIKRLPDSDVQKNETLQDTLKIADKPQPTADTQRDSIVNFALSYLNTPYTYGASSKDGFDCSGFVYFVFKHFKISVPRSSVDYKTFGKTIAIGNIQKGDVLIFLSPTRNEIGHVGIVTKPSGMETEFIHATSGKEMMVVLSSLKQENYNRRFVKAISVL